jgi:hypothetical protein
VLVLAIYLFCLPGSKWYYRLRNTQRKTDLQQGFSIELVTLKYCARVPLTVRIYNVHSSPTETGSYIFLFFLFLSLFPTSFLICFRYISVHLLKYCSDSDTYYITFPIWASILSPTLFLFPFHPSCQPFLTHPTKS